jgi:hypothetical protein
LESFTRIQQLPRREREVQTDIEVEDLIAYRLRDPTASNRNDNKSLHALEARMQSFQRQVESRCKEELERQVDEYKRVELASARLEDRKEFAAQLSRQKQDFEMKIIEIKASHVDAQEEVNKRAEMRERDLERGNMELKQRLYEETNRMVIKETGLRNDAELAAKEIKMEKEMIQRRYTELQRQFEELQTFKEKYTQKMESQMTSYKIELNQEYSARSVEIQVQRQKLDGDTFLT